MIQRSKGDIFKCWQCKTSIIEVLEDFKLPGHQYFFTNAPLFFLNKSYYVSDDQGKGVICNCCGLRHEITDFEDKKAWKVPVKPVPIVCNHEFEPVLLLTSTVYNCKKCGRAKEE